MTWRRPIKKEHRYHIYNRDENKCLSCGSETNLTIDHIKPLSKGGPNHPTNYQTLCLKCNLKKADNVEDFRKIKIVGKITLPEKFHGSKEKLEEVYYSLKTKHQSLEEKYEILNNQVKRLPSIIKWFFKIDYAKKESNSSNKKRYFSKSQEKGNC